MPAARRLRPLRLTLAPRQVTIKVEKPLEGTIRPDRMVIDADNLRKLIGDPSVRALARRVARQPR